MQYAETQTSINGPYVQTALTLEECWQKDLADMVDYNLLRDNASTMEQAALGYIMEAIHTNYPEEVPEVYLNIANCLEFQLEESITTRILAAGQYVRDSKWTRSTSPAA